MDIQANNAHKTTPSASVLTVRTVSDLEQKCYRIGQQVVGVGQEPKEARAALDPKDVGKSWPRLRLGLALRVKRLAACDGQGRGILKEKPDRISASNGDTRHQAMVKIQRRYTV